MCVCVCVCVCHIFFIYSSVFGYLGCFHVLAIVNSAAMNTGLQVSFQMMFSPDICPWVGLQGHMLPLFLVFLRNFHSVLHSGCQWVSSISQSCPILGNPMDCRMPGFPVYHQLVELTQTHTQRVSDVIQPSHLLLSPSPPTVNLLQHQGLFQWVSYSHQVAKVLEFQLQHQPFQLIFRTDFL